jgi:hypothetical protein
VLVVPSDERPTLSWNTVIRDELERESAVAQTTRTRRHENKKALIIIAIFVVVFFAWTRGTFDNFLWRVHLNYTDCGQNAFGATFCGDQLKQYNKRFGTP